MTPKEKAEELFSKYSYLSETNVPTLGIKVAKQCALIAVREILNNDNNLFNTFIQNDYWLQVKQELEKISPKEPVFKMRKIEPAFVTIETSKGFLYRLWFILSTPFVWLFQGKITIK